MNEHENDLQIGIRIRQRREELGLSLRELARRIDLTASFLSQVEHDRANPSINSLRRIAAALGVSILHFLSEAPKPDPVVRADHRAKLILPGSGLTYELLVPDLTRKMEVFAGRLNAGRASVPVSRLREPTEECIYVLSGKLRIGLESGEYDLDTGDSIYFEGTRLKSIANGSGSEMVEWISIITPPVF